MTLPPHHPPPLKKNPMMRAGARTHSIWEVVVECKGSAAVRMLSPRGSRDMGNLDQELLC